MTQVSQAAREAAMLREIANSEARGKDWQVNLTATADYLDGLDANTRAEYEKPFLHPAPEAADTKGLQKESLCADGASSEYGVGGVTSAEYHIEVIEDRPEKGQWHCGPNATWVTVTHLPTMISARAFDQSHHHARQAAMTCCEMLVEQSRLLKCHFPERLK